MKKIFYVLCFLSFVIFIKFLIADYEITYDVDGVKVTEKANSDYIYFEIEYGDTLYNYAFFTGRKLTKKRVSKVEVEDKNGYVCVKPIIKGMDGYFVCSDENHLISEQVARGSIEISSLDEDFSYNKNLSDDEFILIWKYDGFYYLNGDKYKSINIFEKDRYSNDLMFMLNGYLIFPKYDNNYLFSDFIILDSVTGNYRIVSSKYKISYDAYIVGNNKNSIYLFENKENVLYEVNYKKNSVKVVGNNEKGYIKYLNSKKEKASLSEFTRDKITFFNSVDKFVNVDKNTFSYKMNEDVRIKFFDNEDIHVINTKDDNIYFIYKDNLYRYNNSGVTLVAHNFEFNFNYERNVFVYKR